MKDLAIKTKYARITEANRPGEQITNSVRTYKDKPGTVALQIRAYSPLVRGGKGRNLIAHVPLTADEAKQLIEQLQAFLKEEGAL